MKKINVDTLERLMNRYTFEAIKELYIKYENTQSLFSKNVWKTFFGLATLLIVISVFISSLWLSIVAFVIGTFSVSKITKISMWSEVVLEGADCGYEYGRKNLYLNLLKKDVKVDYETVKFLMYPQGYFWEDPDDKELYEFLYEQTQSKSHT